MTPGSGEDATFFALLTVWSVRNAREHSATTGNFLACCSLPRYPGEKRETDRDYIHAPRHHGYFASICILLHCRLLLHQRPSPKPAASQRRRRTRQHAEQCLPLRLRRLSRLGHAITGRRRCNHVHASGGVGVHEHQPMHQRLLPCSVRCCEQSVRNRWPT